MPQTQPILLHIKYMHNNKNRTAVHVFGALSLCIKSRSLSSLYKAQQEQVDGSGVHTVLPVETHTDTGNQAGQTYMARRGAIWDPSWLASILGRWHG